MSGLFPYLARSGGCLAAFYLFYRLVLAKDKNFALNRAFLVGSAALSLVLPLVHVPSPFARVVAASRLPDLPPLVGAAPAPVSAPSLRLADTLPWAYLAGAGLFLLLFLVRLVRLGLMAARCGCRRDRGLRIVLCGRAGESFSFFNFVFLDASELSGGDLERVLTHELAHVRQLHSFDVLLAEVLTVVQWFNPFVWPYRGSLRETHEYLADRAVVAQGCGLARYQLLIVEQHVGGRLLELASGLRTSRIKRRIAMLSRQETKGLARWKPLLILPLALVFVLAFAESRAVVAPEGQEAAKATQATPAAQAIPAVEPTEEEMIKALKEKWAKLQGMKAKNAEALELLAQKLEGAADPAEQEKIKAKLQEEKLFALELTAKEQMLQMKKLEFVLNKEANAEKKAELEKKLLQLRAESEETLKKLQAAGRFIKVKMKEPPEKE